MLAYYSKITWYFLVLCAWSLCIDSAAAGILKVHIAGHVTDWEGGLGTEFAVGDLLSLDYSFDTQTVDQQPNNNFYGAYDFLSFEGMLGNYAFKASHSYALTAPQSNPFGDQFFVHGKDFLLGADVAGSHLVAGTLFLRDFDSTFLNGDSLPLSAPDLSIMEQSGFALGFDTPAGDRILVRAELDSTSIQEIGNSSVPEPGSFFVVLGLCIAIASIRYRKCAIKGKDSFSR